MRNIQTTKLRRFENKVAIQFQDGEFWTQPVYILGEHIKKLAAALNTAAIDIENNRFEDSNFETRIIPDDRAVIRIRLKKDVKDAELVLAAEASDENRDMVARAKAALEEFEAKANQ